MVGPLAYGIGPDPVAVAKVLNDFAKGNEKFVITGGAMPGQVMSAKEIAALASLPSRDELHRQAARHDAGAGREVRPDDERGAVEVRPRARRGARREAGGLKRPPIRTDIIQPYDSGATQCPQSKLKSSTRSRR